MMKVSVDLPQYNFYFIFSAFYVGQNYISITIWDGDCHYSKSKYLSRVCGQENNIQTNLIC